MGLVTTLTRCGRAEMPVFLISSVKTASGEVYVTASPVLTLKVEIWSALGTKAPLYLSLTSVVVALVRHSVTEG